MDKPPAKMAAVPACDEQGMIRELQAANAALDDSRRAAFNLMEDAIEARQDAERVGAKLRMREEQLRLFVKHAPAAIAMLDNNMRYVSASQRWLADYGLAGRDVTGLSYYELFPEIPERWRAIHRRCLTGESMQAEEDPFDRADGSRQWIRWEIHPWKSGLENIGGIIIFSEDITVRKQAQAELLASRRRAELLARTAGELLASQEPQRVVERLCRDVMVFLDCHAFFNFIVDEEAGRLHLNACAGIPADEAARIEWLDYGVAVCGCVAQQGERIIAEDILHTPDLRTDLVKGYGIQAYCCHPLLAQGRVIGTLSFGTRSRTKFSDDDVALMHAVADLVALAMDRMRDSEALRESREDLNRAQAVAHAGSWRMNVQKNELLWSDENWRIFGVPKETPLTYETFLNTVHPDDRAQVDQKWLAALRGEPYDLEHRIVVGNTVKWVHERAELEFDKEGSLLGAFGTTQDITERKQIEETYAFLSQCGYVDAGEDFFQALARYLARTLDMGYVCIDRLLEGDMSAETVAVYNDGKFEDNITYALKDTPCGDVAKKAMCCFPRDVCRLFPRDAALQELRAESYIGTILWGFDGKPIGLIAVIGRTPLANPALAKSILRLVAVRAAGELERKEAETARDEAHRRTVSILESIGDGFFSLDRQWRVTYINERGAQLLGTSRAAMLGANLWEKFADVASIVFRQAYERALAEQITTSVEAFYPPLDAWFEAHAYPSPDGLSIFFQNITERKRAEAELQRLNRTLKALNKSDQAFLRAGNEAEYLDGVCRIIVEDCGHAMVWIGYAESDGGKSVRPVASAGFEKGYLETLKITWDDSERGRGPTGTAIRTGKPCGCANMLTDPLFAPWREAAIKHGYASSIVLPLLAEDKAFGALSIYSPQPDAFSAHEVRLLADLAGNLAHGIGALRLREAKQQADRERIMTVDFLRIVNGSAGMRDLVRDAVVFFKEQSGCHAVGIRLREGDNFPYYETQGFPKAFLEDGNSLCASSVMDDIIRGCGDIPFFKCICGSVIGGRCDASSPFFTPAGSFWTNHMAELFAHAGEETHRRRVAHRCNIEGEESVALIPLRFQDEHMGLLQLNDPRKGMFTPESVARMERLAGYLSVALAKFRAEDEVKSVARFSEENPAAVLRILADGTLAYANPAARRVMLAALGGSRGMTAPELLRQPALASLALGRSQEAEFDCAGRVFAITCVPFTDSGYVNIHGRDVTAKRVAEKEARLSREREQEARIVAAAARTAVDVLDAMGEGLLLLDMNGHVLSVNPALQQMTGNPEETVVGLSVELFVARFIVEEDHAAVLQALRRALQGHPEGARVFTLVGRGGRMPVISAISFIRDVGGKPTALVVTLRDISELHAMQQTLEASERKYRELVENANSIIMRITPDHTITFFNEYAQKFFGYTAREILGKNVRGTIVPANDSLGQDLHGMLMRVTANPELHGTNENENICKDGRRVWVYWANRAIRDDKGNVVELLCVGSDITERKRMEAEAMRYQQRLRALSERLAAAEEEDRWRISRYIHDTIIQNLSLSSIRLGSIAKPLADADLKEESGKLLQIRGLLDEAIDECRMVMSDLTPALLYELGLVPALHDLAQQLEAKHGIRMIVEDDGQETPLSHPLRGLLFESIRELIMNALKHAAPGEIHVSVNRRGNDLVIRVRDDGKGFDPEMAKKVPDHQGGFGLLNVRQRLEGLGGQLEITSGHGKGTAATISVPVTSGGE